MSESDHVLFAGADGTLSSFGTTRAVAPDSIPPLDARKPGVTIAFGPVRITAPLGREIGYLQVGEFRQPLLPRRRVWRSGPTQLVFPQPVPQRYWQLDVDAPPAAHARLDAVLGELCKFHPLKARAEDEPAISEAEESLYAGCAKESSPSPLVLDAIAAIKLRSVPVAQASQEINEKKLGPQRIVSNPYSAPSSRSSSYRKSSASVIDYASESGEPSELDRPQTEPAVHLITPETSRELNIAEDPRSPTKAAISRFDYFESPLDDDDRQLSPLTFGGEPEHKLLAVCASVAEQQAKLEGPVEFSTDANASHPDELSCLHTDSATQPSEELFNLSFDKASERTLIESPGKLGSESPPLTPKLEALTQEAFTLSPVTPTSARSGVFDSTPVRLKHSAELLSPDLEAPMLFEVSPSDANGHSVSSSSTLDEILDLFAPDAVTDTKPPLDGPTVSELAQRQLLSFSTASPSSPLPGSTTPFRESVRFSHPLIPAPASAISYRMRQPRPAMPQSVHHDVTTVGGFIGWHLMNRIIPPRR